MIFGALAFPALMLAACAAPAAVEGDGQGASGLPSPQAKDHKAEGTAALGGELEIITLLPKDAIPSIDAPDFYLARQADLEYEPQEMVLGVVFDGQARAYSVNMLSRHEIVNDKVAGRPIAITW